MELNETLCIFLKFIRQTFLRNLFYENFNHVILQPVPKNLRTLIFENHNLRLSQS